MNNVMVCVTQQKSCDRLIRFGKGLIQDNEDELFIIHIAHPDYSLLGHSEESEALEYLYQKALEYGANLTVVRSDDVIKTMGEQVEKHQINKVVMGESRQAQQNNNVADKFAKAMEGKAEMVIVPLHMEVE